MSSDYRQQYYQNNENPILPKVKEYQKDKYDNNLQYKLIKRYQSRVDNYYNKQIYKAEDLLKCNSSFFKLWIMYCLEDTNLTNSPIDNIHLHHFRPINTFTKNNVKLGFHWTNVLPVTKESNVDQSDNRDKDNESIQKDRVIRLLSKVKLEMS